MSDISSNVTVGSLSGDILNGGWKCTLTTMQDTDILERHQGVQVTWRPSLGGNFGSPLPAFSGHVFLHKMRFTGTHAMAEIEACTTDEFLRDSWMQGIHFRDVGAAFRVHFHEDDNAHGNLTLGKIVRHILGYKDAAWWVSHTNTVFNGIENKSGWIGIDDVVISAFDAVANPLGSMRTDSYIVEETDNIWRTLQQIAGNEFFTIYFDKLNNLHYKRHPMFQAVLPDPVMVLTAAHLVGAPEVELRPEFGTYAESGYQIVLHAVTDDGSTLHASVPDSGEMRVQGKRKEISYVRCNAQAALTFWARRLYDYETREYTVRIELPGMSGLLFELLDRVAITYVGTAYTGLDINWTNKMFWIHKIDVTPDKSMLTLESENSSI